jgi:maltose alpha-D-glucosyltransferase / alpha-amylase
MRQRPRQSVLLTDDPGWYRDAIIYELHVRAFADSSGDGRGDFRGLAQKLDYLEDLGVTAIWLLPFYPSPLKDDGYDIADYTDVHPSYGTLADFRYFLREAHRRGLRVITELVLNHTSDQHPWFQRARRAPAGSNWRDFYVWSDTTEKYKDARIIFKDFEASNWSWDTVANAYYWHRFYHHQPDLNFDNPEVHRALFQVVDLWLEMGVDGMRLDAVPYLYQREGTNCENLPETHEFLRALRRHVDARFPNRMLLAEANQWPEDAVSYFGMGDECHMAFHFPVMPRMFMADHMEDRYPIIDILQQTPPIPDNCQWALFLRNHDELTLEMVTDEERDYMYRVYAYDPEARINLGIRRRLAPLLGNSRRKIEMMNGLLFSLPGTPVIYYGDEIGMGDNIYLGDRNGVRTPMQWSPDRNAGFSRANPQRLYLPVIVDPDFHFEALNVEAQQNNPNSLLWWMKRTIALRKQFRAFSRGSIEFLYPENGKVLAFLRRFGEEIILVVANLSRLAQYVELDLGEYKGMVPVELSGRTEFPPIGELPYLLTLGPKEFYWFALQPERVSEAEIRPGATAAEAPVLHLSGGWESLLDRESRAQLERLLPAYLRTRRWFGGKARRIKSVRITDVVPVPLENNSAYLAITTVEYTEGDSENYTLTMAFAAAERAEQVKEWYPHAILARLEMPGGEGLLFSGLREPAFCDALLDAIARRRRLRAAGGEITATPTRLFRQVRGPAEERLETSLLRTEQSNSSVLYGTRMILKMFRRLETGTNPDLEIGSFLTERARFQHIPPVAGSLEYRNARGETMTLGILEAFVTNEGDAWKHTLGSLGHFFEQVVVRPPDGESAPVAPGNLLDWAGQEVPAVLRELCGPYLESARLLGQRTGELHVALASDRDDPSFAPEPFSALYQRSIYQSMRNLTVRVLGLLRGRLGALPESAAADADRLLAGEADVLARLRQVVDRRISGLRIRVHGDYHLGQVLFTGRDFVILDFEGEPARAISERRIKRSPLRDVAGMIRSFHYAAHTALAEQVERGVVRQEDVEAFQPWARAWYQWVSAVFLKAYFEAVAPAALLPAAREEIETLLDALLLEKAVYELGYELNNRPDWVGVPLKGILELLAQRP